MVKRSQLVGDSTRGQRPVGVTYKGYVLGAMTGVATLNYLDRVFIGLFLQPIKVDLHLSDTQLGFLTGIAFALFYAVLGIPISRWADRGNRVSITSLAIGMWGATVMACMFVTNFAQLLLARVAAAVGESGCIPPTYSLVGDYFPKPGERARALAIYMAANPLTVLIGSIAGGWLNDQYGWRMSFFIIGIPGLLMALLVKATVAETPGRLAQTQGVTQQIPQITQVVKCLWHQRSSRYLALGYIFFSALGDGLAPWYGAFLIRTHGMSTAEFGIWFGLIVGITGLIANCLGGYIVGRWLARNEARQLRLAALTSALLAPCLALFLLLPQKHQALITLVPFVLMFGSFTGPIYALMQRLVPDNMRATALAMVLLLSNLIGCGIVPQIVGIISDALEPSLGINSLRYAMLAVALAALLAAYQFWRANRTVGRDLEDLQRVGLREELSPHPDDSEQMASAHVDSTRVNLL